MAVVFNLGTNGNWAYEDASLLPYYVDANNKYNGVRMSAFRAGIATRTTREGLLESMTVDIPRIDFAENANGQLFVEDAATNLVENSDEGRYGNFPSSEVNEESPTGDDTAIRPVVASNSNRYEQIISGGTYPTGQKLVYSWYRKRISTPVDDTKTGDLYVNALVNMNGKSQTQIESERNGYDRFQSVIEIVDGSLESKWRGYFGAVIGVGNSSVAYWGHQFEEGENATSLIPTNGSTEPRAADTGITTGDISHLINSEEGVFEFVASVSETTENNFKGISLSDGTTNNRISFTFYNTGLSINAKIGNVTQVEENIKTISKNTSYKVKVVWDLNVWSIYVDDTLEHSETSVSSFPANTLNKLNLNSGGGSSIFFGRLDYVKIYDSADDY